MLNSELIVLWGHNPLVGWFYQTPVCLNQNKWAEAVLLREDYDQGKITETKYRHAIGCAVENPLPNIKMMIFENNWLMSTT